MILTWRGMLSHVGVDKLSSQGVAVSMLLWCFVAYLEGRIKVSQQVSATPCEIRRGAMGNVTWPS